MKIDFKNRLRGGVIRISLVLLLCLCLANCDSKKSQDSSSLAVIGLSSRGGNSAGGSGNAALNESIDLTASFGGKFNDVIAVKSLSNLNSNIVSDDFPFSLTTNQWTKLSNAGSIKVSDLKGKFLRFGIIPKGTSSIQQSDVIEIGDYKLTDKNVKIGFSNIQNLGSKKEYGILSVLLIAKSINKTEFESLKSSLNTTNILNAQNSSQVSQAIDKISSWSEEKKSTAKLVSSDSKIKVASEDAKGSNVSNTSKQGPNQKPTIPVNLSAINSETSITLTWENSKDSDGSIADYEVSKDSGTNWISSGSDLTHTFANLTIGSIYVLQVRAKDNKNAYSDIANTSLKLGNKKPSQPTNLVANSTSTITLVWNASTDPDGSITDYEVSKDYGTNWISSGTDLTHTFTNLTFGNTYTLQVRAKDNENTYSDVTSVVSALITRQVKKVTLSGTNSFIETTDNKLFVFGANYQGQLGLGNNLLSIYPKCKSYYRNGTSYEYCHTPIELTSISGKVKKVTLSGTNSFIETTDNKLFVFGYNDYGQLGLGDTNYRNTPTELTDSRIRGKVKKVTLSGTNSFIETTDNKLFVFGGNGADQLGLGDRNNRNTPTELTRL